MINNTIVDNTRVLRSDVARLVEQDLLDYENPPIADNKHDQYLNAMQYVLIREWSVSKAIEKAGDQIKRSTLYKYVKLLCLYNNNIFYFLFYIKLLTIDI